MQRLRHILWVGFILLIVSGCLGACGRRKEEGLEEAVLSEETDTPEIAAEGEKPSVIYVYVCGKVAVPGVYELPEGDRVADAIEAAGGMTEEAEEFYLNQAELLADGQKVYVPDKGETAENVGAGGDTLSGAGKTPDGEQKINLNTASKEELMTLSGIGEIKARSIVDYRQEHGAFQSIEEIRQVEGIKDGVFNRIKDRIII